MCVCVLFSAHSRGGARLEPRELGVEERGVVEFDRHRERRVHEDAALEVQLTLHEVDERRLRLAEHLHVATSSYSTSRWYAGAYEYDAPNAERAYGTSIRCKRTRKYSLSQVI